MTSIYKNNHRVLRSEKPLSRAGKGWGFRGRENRASDEGVFPSPNYKTLAKYQNSVDNR